VMWLVSYGFCSKFHTLSSSAKFENRLKFNKVTDSLKVETFLRRSVQLFRVYSALNIIILRLIAGFLPLCFVLVFRYTL